MGISVDWDIVAKVEQSLLEGKMSRLGGIIGTVLPFKQMYSIVFLHLSMQTISSMSIN